MYQTFCATKKVDKFPVLLLGNKVDLDQDRVVSTEQGETLAKKLNCLFMETSSKLRHNINESINELLRHIVTYSGQEVRVVVVGGRRVGKSSYTIQFIQHRFTELCEPPIEDLYKKLVKVVGAKLQESNTKKQTTKKVKKSEEAKQCVLV